MSWQNWTSDEFLCISLLLGGALVTGTASAALYGNNMDGYAKGAGVIAWICVAVALGLLIFVFGEDDDGGEVKKDVLALLRNTAYFTVSATPPSAACVVLTADEAEKVVDAYSTNSHKLAHLRDIIRIGNVASGTTHPEIAAIIKEIAKVRKDCTVSFIKQACT
jgi:hypothetical protein